MPVITKEVLITTLTHAVVEVNQTNASAQGVVLFGSWGRGAARADSDVDLVYVVSGNFHLLSTIECLHILRRRIDEQLKPFHLRQHHSGDIIVETLDRVLTGEAHWIARSFLEGICRWFDESSVVVAIDPDLSKRIKTFADSLDRTWIPPVWLANSVEHGRKLRL